MAQQQMSDDEKARILDALRNRGTSEQCSECKQGAYQVLGFMALSVGPSATGDTHSGDPNAVGLICPHCGHIVLHATFMLGI